VRPRNVVFPDCQISGCGVMPWRMRKLGLIRDYDSLCAVLRRRADEFDVTFATLDAVGGLTDRYSQKILSPRRPCRLFGRASFGALLGALGIVLIAVEDPEQLSRVRSRLVKRRRNGPHRQSVGRVEAR